MSDEQSPSENVVPPEVNEQPKVQEPTPEQLQAQQDAIQISLIKQQMAKQLSAIYRQFIEKVRSFPVDKVVMTEALRNFFTGYVLAEKAIELAPLSVKKRGTANDVPPPEGKPESQPEAQGEQQGSEESEPVNPS
jgi:hypothetical protein